MLEVESSKAEFYSQAMSLAQHWYTEESIYRRDVAWIRQRTWMMVGHESQIPNAGNYFLYDFDKDSVIVIRDAQGEIRALYNVCRHRGSRICTMAKGSVRALSCPYHAWTYGLDGKLRSAPFAPADFRKESFSLVSCHVRVHHGLIFISFAESPSEFSDYINLLTRELELQRMRNAKVAGRQILSANANWKLVVQNNLECYHCRPAHPTYCAAHPGTSLGKPEEYAPRIRYDRVRSAHIDSITEAVREFKPFYSGCDSHYLQFLDRQLIGEGVLTESVDGRQVAPWMGESTRGVQTLCLPSPWTTVVLNPDHAVIYSFTPRAVRRTDMEVIWLVDEAAIEGVDYELERLMAIWQPTLKEDKMLAENTQLGIESTVYKSGPYIGSETLVRDFDRWYMKGIEKQTVSR